jgi:tetratricopeptide (TPR) repeat protein
MQIRRDYSQPFFGTRRRRRGTGRLLFVYGLLMGGFLVFVSSQFPRLQLTALDMVGMAPTPTPFASTLASQAYERYLAGDLEESAALFQQAHQQQPDNIDYLYEYGRLLIELDRGEEAIPLGDRIIELLPLDPRGYALKAKALVWVDRSEDAIPVGLAGLDVDHNYAPLHAALARAYIDIGRYQEALERGAFAVERDPMSVDAHRSYAVALIFVGEREAAIAELEEAVALHPNLVNTYFELAVQYRGMELYREAIATYERIRALDPFNAKALLRLCETYFQYGEAEQAEGYCEDALNIDSNYADAYKVLGMANYNRRNYEGAIENFEKCVENGSRQVECWYLRGLAHYYLGDCDQAWDLLEESLPMAEAIPGGEAIVANITEGLRLTTVSCPGYAGRGVPTLIPPTAIPPTPIGG